MSLATASKQLVTNCAGTCRIVRKYPATLIWPLLVFGLVLALGIWGVIRIAQVEENSAKSRASSLALDTAIWFSQQLSVTIAPVQLMAAMVLYKPHYDDVQSMFQGLAPSLLQQDPLKSIKQLEYAPNGIVMDIYPLEGNNGKAAGLDIFNSTDREGARKTVQDRELTLVGPLAFYEGGHGVIVRNPIFVSGVMEDETFGIPRPINSFCKGPCGYNPVNKTKFWGFASGLIDLDKLSSAKDSKLQVLQDFGYRYEVRALDIADASMNLVSASSEALSHRPVEALINLPNTKWVVRVAPEGGWRPENFGGLLAAVVVVSMALSLLLFAALVSRKRHQMLLEALLPQHVINDLHGAGASLLGQRILQAETTADLMLNMLGRLLEGFMPDLRDVVYIRQAIIRGVDLYQPTDLKQHIRNANLDNEVACALMQQLGDTTLGATAYDGSIRPPEPDCRIVPSSTLKGMTQTQQDCSTLAGALALILTLHPVGWRDVTDVPTEQSNFENALLPARDTEAGSAASPRHSAFSGMLRAMSLVREGGGGTLSGAAPLVPTLPVGSIAGVHRPGISMVLVREEDGQLHHRKWQHQQQATDSRLSRVATDLEPQAQAPQAPPPALPPPQSELVAVVGASESDGRLTPNSSSTTYDENVFGAGTFSVVRRLPRRVASAINILGRPRTALQRRSSLVVAINNSQADVILERRLAIAASAVPAAGATVGSGIIRRASVASVASVPEVAMSGCPPSDALTGEVLGLGGGLGIEMLSGVPARLALTLATSGAGGGCLRRSQLGGSSRTLALQRVQNLPPPPPPVIDEVEQVLAGAGNWHFDTWRLRDVTNGHPLSALGFYLMHRAGLIVHFNLKPVNLVRLLRHIEAGYNDNPYHNATHAADVLQTLHVIIHGAQLHVHYMDHLELLAAYFAAIVHDYGHPGLTNDFLVATSDPLAVRYNDRSPLENHHAAAAFGLLQRPGLDVLAPLSKPERAAFRKQVIEMVLATDMKQHFTFLSQFNTAHRLAGFVHEVTSASEPTSSKNCPTAGTSRSGWNPHSDFLEVVVDSDVCTVSPEFLAPKPLDDTERLLSLQLAIKAADLGHLGEDLEVHQRWLAALEEELFRQGDKERQLGLPISPLFDRSKQGVSKSQVGFYEFVALPLVHALCSAFHGTSTLMRCFLVNYNHWRSLEGKAPVVVPLLKSKPGLTAMVAGATVAVGITGASVIPTGSSVVSAGLDTPEAARS